MDHAAYVLPAYALGVIVPMWLGLQAALRLARARRRLAAVETRGRRP